MSIESQATYSDPSIHFLTQVLSQVRDGSIRVPRFQRPFVWLEDRQLELLRSIRQGIPIGALMIWKTAGAPVRYYEDLGGLRIARGTGGAAQQYLLDGVQRISTLYRALAPTEEILQAELGDGTAQLTYFSFKEDDFVVAAADDKALHLMPLNVIVDTLSLIKYQRSLADNGALEWLQVSDGIARSFRDYKVPIIPIATNDLEIATTTFRRVNRQGEEMSDLHMIHALTWSNEFDLQEKIENAKDDVLKLVGWSNVEDDVLLKVCKGICGLNLYKTDPTKLSEQLKDDPSVLDQAISGVLFAANWFKSVLSIQSPQDVPYTFQIVFTALLALKLDKEKHALLFSNWFWFTTYSEAFSGMSDDRVRKALDDFSMMLESGRPVWSDRRKKVSFSVWQGDRFDFRSVRTKAILLSLARRIHDETGHDAFSELSKLGRDAVQPLFSRNVVGRRFSSLGNRLLVSDPMLLHNIRNGTADDAERAAHFIPPDFPLSRPVAGLDVRADLIERYIRQHINKTAEQFNENLPPVQGALSVTDI